MMVVWSFYDDHMVVLWWLYGGCMVVFNGGCMVVFNGGCMVVVWWFSMVVVW